MNCQPAIRIVALASLMTASLSFAADAPPAWAYGAGLKGLGPVPGIAGEDDMLAIAACSASLKP